MYVLGQVDGVTRCDNHEGVVFATIKNYLTRMAKNAEKLPCPVCARSKLEELAVGEFPSCAGSSCCTCSSVQANNPNTSSCSCCGGGCCGGKCSITLYDGSGAQDEKTARLLEDQANEAAQKAQAENTGNNAKPTVDSAQEQVAPAFRATESGGTTTPEPDADVIPEPTDEPDVYPSIKTAVEATDAAAKKVEDARTTPPNRDSMAADQILKFDAAMGTQQWQNPDNTKPGFNVELTVPSTIPDLLGSSLYEQQQQDKLSAEEFKRQFCDNRVYPECEFCEFANKVKAASEVDLYSILRNVQICLNTLSVGNIQWAEQMFNCPGQLAAMLGQNLGPLGEIVGHTAAAAIIGLTAAHGALNAYANVCHTLGPTDFRDEFRHTCIDAIRSGGCTGGGRQNIVPPITRRGLPNDAPPVGTLGYKDLINAVLIDLGMSVADMFCEDIGLPSVAVDMAFKDPVVNNEDLWAGFGPNRFTNPVREAEIDGVHVPSPEAELKANSVAPIIDDLNRLGAQAADVPDPLDIVPTVSADEYEPTDLTIAEDGPYYIRVTFEPSDDLTVVPGVTYYTRSDETFTPATVTPGAKITEPLYIKVIPTAQPTKPDEAVTKFEPISIAPGESLETVRINNGPVYTVIEEDLPGLPQTQPLVFEGGKMFEPVIPGSMQALLTEVVSTPKMVTKTHVPAAEMAELAGIGLSLNEIQMAYVLDSEINGSELPRDVKAELIPTILDTFPEW